MSKSPMIEIDHDKCLVPFYCKKCLQVCPQAVFDVQAVKIEKFKETDPKELGAYKLKTAYRRQCTACNKCVEVCDKEAITITY